MSGGVAQNGGVRDALSRELRKLEAENPLLARTDTLTTKRVGGSASKRELRKVQHDVPVISLQDVFSKEEVDEFVDMMQETLDDPEFVVEYKIDGLAINLIYENGVFSQAVTRGDGTVGEDVTSNVKTIISIPMSIPYKQRYDIRGEVYMPKTSFERVNRERRANGEEEFANPRNAAAGSIRQLDSRICASRGLDGFWYHVPDDINCSSHFDSLMYAKKLGFAYINFYTQMPNERDYVVSRIRKFLN